MEKMIENERKEEKVEVLVKKKNKFQFNSNTEQKMEFSTFSWPLKDSVDLIVKEDAIKSRLKTTTNEITEDLKQNKIKHLQSGGYGLRKEVL